MCIRLNRATLIVAVRDVDRELCEGACIGKDIEHLQHGMFDTAYMKSLYDYAYQLASSGHAWHKSPPSVDQSQQ